MVSQVEIQKWLTMAHEGKHNKMGMKEEHTVSSLNETVQDITQPFTVSQW